MRNNGTRRSIQGNVSLCFVRRFWITGVYTTTPRRSLTRRWPGKIEEEKAQLEDKIENDLRIS